MARSRLGGMGPALLPESLERLRPAEAARVIALGPGGDADGGLRRAAGAPTVAALAQWIYTPVSPRRAGAKPTSAPRAWRRRGARALPAKPKWQADPMNLFVVVEGGDHHVSLVDGDRFEVIHRFASRFALHGGPKFSPDGRYVYFGSRDGWITKYDLWNLVDGGRGARRPQHAQRRRLGRRPLGAWRATTCRTPWRCSTPT